VDSPVTVITPSLPERDEMRRECVACVGAQLPSLDGVPYVAAHLIGIDHARAGVAATLNQLWPGAASEWVAVLADDDLLDPDYLRTVFSVASWGTSTDSRLFSGDYGIYYTYCRVQGAGWSFNRPFDADALRQANYIPATAVIRRALLEELGGWREYPGKAGLEDWELWLRALDAGARFRCIRQIKWTYRFHGRNLSLLPAIRPAVG
jgi:GT2 family glycosyltransferase